MRALLVWSSDVFGGAVLSTGCWGRLDRSGPKAGQQRPVAETLAKLGGFAQQRAGVFSVKT
jgi:hypothetical protein